MAREKSNGTAKGLPEAPVGDVTPILASIAGLLIFGLGLVQTGLPERLWIIVPVSLLFAVLMTAFVLSVENYRHEGHRRTLLRGRRPLWGLLFVVMLASAVGILTGLASSSASESRPRKFLEYEAQLGRFVGNLERANAKAFEAPDSLKKPGVYAESTRELADAYKEASAVLRAVRPPRRTDQVLHSLLVVRIAAVGDAYADLGTIVASGAREAKVGGARAEVQAAINDLRTTEEALKRRGYRIFDSPT